MLFVLTITGYRFDELYNCSLSALLRGRERRERGREGGRGH